MVPISYCARNEPAGSWTSLAIACNRDELFWQHFSLHKKIETCIVWGNSKNGTALVFDCLDIKGISRG